VSAAPSLSETPALSSATRRALAQYAVLRRPDAGEGLANGLAVDAAGEAPTLEAAAFKQLRALLGPADRWELPTGDDSRWYRPLTGAYSEQLARYRTMWEPADAEVIELHHARLLEPEEVAYVVFRPLFEVREVLAKAQKRADGLFGSSPPSRTGDVAGAIREAFTLALGANPSGERALHQEVLTPGDVVGERYEVVERLGGGAHAEVYRALDRFVPDHEVALKIGRAELRSAAERLHALREIHCLASVFHPSVVHLQHHGWHGDRLWFAMPLYRGQTLEARIEEGPLGRQEALSIFRPLALALDTLHGAGIRHQDIKPENVLLAKTVAGDEESGDILPVLIDFGVAVSAGEVFLAGTPEYLAPEVARQLRGEDQDLDGKADVFSLALCLRDALSPGCFAEGPEVPVQEVIDERATQPVELPTEKDLADLGPHFRRWLASDPDQRPDARTFARDLDLLLEPERKRERRRRRFRWIANGIFISLTVFGALGYGLFERSERHRMAAEASARNAELQEARATRASERAAEVETALQEEVEQRTALESEVQRLSRGSLSRQELAEKLAEAEAANVELDSQVQSLSFRLRQLQRTNADLSEAYTHLREQQGQ
tara:strand:- start:70 stop:1890 length:1821 start_codon:yes stop_codon:yes gene_type:complete